jgi:hypothetical protein
MSYLHARPGFRQSIGGKIYTIIYMHSSRDGAEKCIQKLRATHKYDSVILYVRKKGGENVGRHPFCVGVRGRK